MHLKRSIVSKSMALDGHRLRRKNIVAVNMQKRCANLV